MAKVEGPLFSMQASGTYGGAVTFGRRKGVNVARIRVDPANPQTSGQQDSRNRVRVGGVIQRWMNGTSQVEDGQAATPKALLTTAAPAEQTWNSFLVDLLVGAGAITYTAAEAAFQALSESEQTAWDTAAGALTPPLNAVAQKGPAGVEATPKSGGEVFFLMQYALSQGGLAAAPTATPPTYT